MEDSTYGPMSMDQVFGMLSDSILFHKLRSGANSKHPLKPNSQASGFRSLDFLSFRELGFSGPFLRTTWFREVFLFNVPFSVILQLMKRSRRISSLLF